MPKFSFVLFVFALGSLGFGFDFESSQTPESQILQAAIHHAELAKSEEVLNTNLEITAEHLASLGTGPSKDEILQQIIKTIDGEHWAEVQTHPFGLVKSAFRSQGLTTDETGNYWYSWMKGILKANDRWSVASLMWLFAIPEALTKMGDNHIGDIDMADGKLFVPIEDGSAYKNPYIGIYDSQSLNFEKYFRLPQEQQRDGVPWVAVDSTARRVYSSEYNNVTKINAYDMDTLAPAGQIPFSPMVDSIQGAKVHDGMMYMTANAPAGTSGFALYKLNLSTGTVMQVGAFGDNLVEVEGLTFTKGAAANPADPEINALGVVPVNGWLGKLLHLRRVQLSEFKRDQVSMRDEFRQRISDKRFAGEK